MSTGILFKSIIDEVTDLEKQEIIPAVCDVLSYTHTGNRITGSRIVSMLQARGYFSSGPRLRKMINYIRTHNLCAQRVVVAAGNGYYLTADRHEVQDQIDGLNSRIDSMRAVVDALLAQKQNLERNTPLSDR